jgi:hypothetical protein
MTCLSFSNPNGSPLITYASQFFLPKRIHKQKSYGNKRGWKSNHKSSLASLPFRPDGTDQTLWLPESSARGIALVSEGIDSGIDNYVPDFHDCNPDNLPLELVF